MAGRALSKTYSVSPQITPEDVEAIKAAGFRTVICNRPDEENPEYLQVDAVRAAVEAAGMHFHVLPFNQMTLTLDLVTQQRAIIDASDGPVLAYCASGNRCSVVWALGEAQSGTMALEDIVTTAAEAGYDLRGLLGNLRNLRGA